MPENDQRVGPSCGMELACREDGRSTTQIPNRKRRVPATAHVRDLCVVSSLASEVGRRKSVDLSRVQSSGLDGIRS